MLPRFVYTKQRNITQRHGSSPIISIMANPLSLEAINKNVKYTKATFYFINIQELQVAYKTRFYRLIVLTGVCHF